jgi:anti-sigma factor ChrR (cupin superfamily)
MPKGKGNIAMTHHFSIDKKDLESLQAWEILRPGIKIKTLFEVGTYRVALLRYEAGASVPLHKHEGDEHIFILEGSQSDEHGTYHAGSYVFNPQGSTHSVKSEHGCLVLIHWLASVSFIES